MALLVAALQEEKTGEEHMDVAQLQHVTHLTSIHWSLTGCSYVAHHIPRDLGGTIFCEHSYHYCYIGEH